MIRLLADENFNNNIVRGIRLREPGIDLVRTQDVGLSRADDPSVLEWTAEHQRVLLTHDVATITEFAYERVRAGKPMPGVFELSLTDALRSAIDDIVRPQYAARVDRHRRIPRDLSIDDLGAADAALIVMAERCMSRRTAPA